MSLIVARREGEAVVIVSDTKLTSPTGTLSDPLRGAIKLVPLTGWLAVAYAGNITIAAETINVARFHWLRLSRRELVDRFLQAHRAARHDVEFILAFDSPIELVCVKDGKIQSNDVMWIGDKAGFDRYQQAYLEVEINQPPSSIVWTMLLDSDGASNAPSLRMRRAMEVVIADRTINSVGGFCIVLVRRSFGWMFGEYVHTQTAELGSQTLAEIVQLAVGDAAGGHYTLYFTCGITPFGIWPALYVVEAKLGLVFGAEKSGLYECWRFTKRATYDDFLADASAIPNATMYFPSGLPASEELARETEPAIATLRRCNGDSLAGRLLGKLDDEKIPCPRYRIAVYNVRVTGWEFGDLSIDEQREVDAWFATDARPTFISLDTWSGPWTLEEVFRRILFRERVIDPRNPMARQELSVRASFQSISRDRYLLLAGRAHATLSALTIVGDYEAVSFVEGKQPDGTIVKIEFEI